MAESCGLNTVSPVKSKSKRHDMLGARLSEHGNDGFAKALDEILHSSFLRGKNDKGWVVTFDWLIRPNNFVKVLDGNYRDHDSKPEAFAYDNSTDWGYDGF